MKKATLALVLGVAFAIGGAKAEEAEGQVGDDRSWQWSPIGLGIAAPIQLPWTSTDIWGLRFGGIFGYNRDVYGIDCGVVELSTGDMHGLQTACFTWTGDNAYGVRFGALANVAGGNLAGLAVGAVNVVHGEASGAEIGLVNYGATMFDGFQAGLVNWNSYTGDGWQIAVANCDQDVFCGLSMGLVNYSRKQVGCQLGVVNVTDDASGCQIGLFNACDTIHGVQIGVLNIITSSEKLPIMVIANANF